MKRTIFFFVISFLLVPCAAFCVMECQIVDEEGNAVHQANAGQLIYFKSTYYLDKSKKLAWNLTITLPTIDKKYFKTTIKYSGYYFEDRAFENLSRLIPFVIPNDRFLKGTATFKYALTGNRRCTVYLDILQESEPPTSPTLTATAISPYRIDLSWTISSDNIGVMGYKLYDSSGYYIRAVNGNATYVDGLSPNTEYCYRITAYDAAGNESAYSNIACATTFPLRQTLTGRWTGTWDSTNHFERGSLNAYITQTGEWVTGTVFITGSPCFLSANLQGGIKESNVAFGVVSNDDSISFVCTHDNFYSMKCNYLVENGRCAGDYGTARLNKK